MESPSTGTSVPWMDYWFGGNMRRRKFITLFGGTAATWPLVVRAQQALPVIGVLHGVSAAQWADLMVWFDRGLGEAGFTEGRNVAVEYRWAEGQFERLPAIAGANIGLASTRRSQKPGSKIPCGCESLRDRLTLTRHGG
jgi:hypothetical protein